MLENTGDSDKMSCEKSDIFGKVKPIFQKIAGLRRQFTVNCAFEAGFLRKFTGTNSRVQVIRRLGGRLLGRHLLLDGSQTMCELRRPMR